MRQILFFGVKFASTLVSSLCKPAWHQDSSTTTVAISTAKISGARKPARAIVERLTPSVAAVVQQRKQRQREERKNAVAEQ